MTKVWGLPKARLYATVYREDDEAETLWKQVTDIDPRPCHALRGEGQLLGDGDTGPCGPCSEIHIDLGEGCCDKGHIKGHVCNVNAGCARYIELWNLVFIQYNRDAAGQLTRLPPPHVDTGLGLERTVAVLQDKRSNYDTDLFWPLIEATAKLSGRDPGNPDLLPAFRVIADHARALTFSITDGALPSNEGRATCCGASCVGPPATDGKLGMHEPFIHKLVPTLVEMLGQAIPRSASARPMPPTSSKMKKSGSTDVLDRGIAIFEDMAAKTIGQGRKGLSGDDAFKLYDTYGFPLDLTQLMAREKGLAVDQAGFDAALEAHSGRGPARRASSCWPKRGSGPWPPREDESVFVGYDQLEAETAIRRFRLGEEGQVTVVLAETPFYAESGGQVGDRGVIQGEGFQIAVKDTQKQGDAVLHLGRLTQGHIPKK